jgi:DNA-3-methyladenine glycosylase
VADHEAPAVPAQGTTGLSRRRLVRAFFARPAVEVAPDLLGRVLVHRLPDGTRLAGRIVETEAYEPGDPASHGYRGPTPRNATMFGPPGRLYVYFTYGNHWMANVVARRLGEGSAVLLRALEPVAGLDQMARRRGRDGRLDLCSGPGKLCQALGIDRSLDGADLVRGTSIWLEEGIMTPSEAVAIGTRVGISAGLEHPWRYREAKSAFVSRARAGAPATRRGWEAAARP